MLPRINCDDIQAETTQSWYKTTTVKKKENPIRIIPYYNYKLRFPMR